VKDHYLDSGDYIKLACEFAEVAIGRYEGLGIYTGDYKLNVALTNAAISAELFFKSGLAVREYQNEFIETGREDVFVTIHHSSIDLPKGQRSHDLMVLFKMLPKNEQSWIVSGVVGKINRISTAVEFNSFLSGVSKLFVSRRYPTDGVSFSSNDYLQAESFISFVKILMSLYRQKS
jgi:hypothetical protein